MPAFADEFPSDGYMLEDMVYEESATYGNMGVYDGAVTATAEYDDILYQIAAGTYLPAGSEGDLEICPENSYCPGDVDVTYNETTDQGISSCPSGYPNSAAGASSNTQCYTACTVNSANIEHATAVDGNDYYDDGTDTCVATVCEGGYHVNETTGIVENTPLIDVDYTVVGNDNGFISADGGQTSKADTYGLTENSTWAAEFDYGVVYGRASCQATPYYPGVDYMYENANVDGFMGVDKMSPDQVRSDLTPIVGVAKANYMADVIAGIADGTKGAEDFYEAMYVVFGASKDVLFSTTDTGKYCYCQMTGFQSGSSSVVDIASAPWVLSGGAHGSADDCASNCAAFCSYNLRTGGEYGRVFRGAVFGALDPIVAGTCAANEITINWTDATDEDIAANNAGMCTYGGDIRTPVAAVEKPGKTFVGWKFDVTE